MSALIGLMKTLARGAGAFALAATLFVSAPAVAVKITSGISGNWYDPASDGQGLQFEVLDVDGTTMLFALWFLFDEQGNILWLFGLSEVEGDTVTLEMFQPEDGRFGEPVTRSTRWGEITITFDGCNSATLEFTPASKAKAEQTGTGFKQLQRLTSIKSSECTGGISDDLPPRALPEDFEINLEPTAAAPGASGTLELEVRPGRAELELEVRGLPVGDYQFTVDGEVVAIVTVVVDDGDTEGELELQSPAGPGEELLDFDPRGKSVAVVQDETVFLTGNVPEAGDFPGGGTGGNPPPFGESEIEITLMNLGVYPAGEAEAELEQEPGRVDFDVEVEDIPVGNYDLLVGGQLRGIIEVFPEDGGTEGELEFRFPPEPGTQLLDFDPRGQEIVIAENGTPLFSRVFPATDNGGGENGNEGELELAISLTSTAAAPGAGGEAEYRREPDEETRFRVEIEGVADGNYGLRVGGTRRATIMASGGEGEVEFRSPVEPGKLPLDFNPLGASIEVLDGNTVILEGTMPSG